MENLDLYLRQYKKSGDRIWFEKIYRQFMPPLFRYCYYRTGNRQEAEDICSQLALRAYSNLNSKKFNSRQFFAWLYKVARNLLIDYYRKQDRETRNPSPDKGQEPGKHNGLIDNSTYLFLELGIKNEKLFKALSRLTDLQREVVVLKLVEDFDYKLISRITGKRQNTLRGIVFRALDALRKYIQENE
ncbi:MAG: RNA polymerase sigma factor [Actinomycetota bacterium]|nr:RNA polymerase sigma factor [Actinomycetota bacterium]